MQDALKQIAHGCRVQNPLEVYEEGMGKNHGRLEQRFYESFSASPMLDKWRDEWGFLTQIIRVTRIRARLNSNSHLTECAQIRKNILDLKSMKIHSN